MLVARSTFSGRSSTSNNMRRILLHRMLLLLMLLLLLQLLPMLLLPPLLLLLLRCIATQTFEIFILEVIPSGKESVIFWIKYRVNKFKD